MNLEGIMLSEIRQRKTLYVFTYKKIKEANVTKLKETHWEQTSGYRWGEGWQEEQDKGRGSRDTKY